MTLPLSYSRSQPETYIISNLWGSRKISNLWGSRKPSFQQSCKIRIEGVEGAGFEPA